MRIAYIVSQFPNLTETFVAREIQQIIQHGHEVTICILRPKPAERDPDGLAVPQARKIRVAGLNLSGLASQLKTLFRYPRQFGRDWSDVALVLSQKPSRLPHAVYLLMAASWLARKLEHQGIQYVHGHFLHSEAIVARWLASLLQVPYGITLHVSGTWQASRLLEKVVTDASVLIGDTQEVMNLFDKRYGRQGVLLRNGIDTDELPFLPTERPPRRGIPLIFAAGYFYRKKGYHVLIEACALLRDRGRSFRCRIVGDGDERPTLERLIVHFGVEEYIEMPGTLPFEQLRKEYEQATVFVMPSIPTSFGSDGLPTVLIENMALGIPVVGTNLAGIPDLVRHGKTGMLAEVGSAESLANCLEQVLVDPELRRSLAVNGRRLIESEFDLRKNAERLVRLIENSVV